MLISCREVSFCCCPEITGKSCLCGKEMPPKSAGTGTPRGGLCPLCHPGCGLSPWVAFPSPKKALRDYETVTADKKTLTEGEKCSGQPRSIAVNPLWCISGENLWLSNRVKNCHRLFVGCRGVISLVKSGIVSPLRIIL